MPYNRAVNVMGVAYHYFTIKPGLFEARVFIIIRKINLLGRILFTEKDCRTNYLVRQPLIFTATQKSHAASGDPAAAWLHLVNQRDIPAAALE